MGSRFDDAFLEDVRNRVSISEVIGRYVSWHKKSRPAARDYWACCPFHGEKTPSFHVLDKKGRFHCFGCGVSGDHFRFLMEHAGMSFPEAVTDVARTAGLSLPDAAPLSDAEKRAYAQRMDRLEKEAAQRKREQEADLRQRVLSAGAIWKQTEPLPGTLGERYFEWRCPGLSPPASETEIRFHPALDISPDRPTGQRHPVIVARVTGIDGKGVAIWRIYLKPDGTPLLDRAGKKIKLGYGPSSGGAVRLGGVAKTIGICEGIETGRAVKCLGAPYPVWPCTSTSGIIGFKIPDGVDKIVIYSDPDGEKWKERQDRTGALTIVEPAGPSAGKILIRDNPDRDIVFAESAFNDDYLEILQQIKGVPKR